MRPRYWTQICALFAACFLLAQCAYFKDSSETLPDILEQESAAKWFNRSQAYQLTNAEGSPQTHLFFDYRPELNLTQYKTNFVLLEPENTRFHYELDPVSGQPFFVLPHCRQNDVWDKLGKTSQKIPFGVGVIPRFYNQLSEPQKIIIFGMRENLQQGRLYQARLLGGVVENVCYSGSCLSGVDWYSRLVLVGIDADNPDWANIQDTQSFLKKVKWSEVRNHLQNSYGLREIGGIYYPSLKAGELVPLSELVSFIPNHTIELKENQLSQISKTCQDIYEKAWTEVGTLNWTDREPTTPEERKEKARWIQEQNKQKKGVTFQQRLLRFFKNHGQDYKTCTQFLYPGNSNHQLDQFIFQTYLTLFVQLHKEGWLYECSQKAWNPYNKGSQAFDLFLANIPQCLTEELNAGFLNLPQFLRSLRGLSGFKWRFITWDEHEFGSHKKIYRWVRYPDRAMNCERELQKKFNEQSSTHFEKDFSWPRKIIKGATTDDIIY